MQLLVLLLIFGSFQVASTLNASAWVAQEKGGCISENPIPRQPPYQEEGFQNPRLMRQSTPKYTKEAKKLGVEGRIVLQILVRKDGSISDFRIVESLGYGLDEKTIAEMRKKWKFRPATRDGKPLDTRAVVALNFRLGSIREVKLAHFGRRPFPMRLQLADPCPIQLVQIEDEVVQRVIGATLRLTGIQGGRFDLEIESESGAEQILGLTADNLSSFGLPGVERDYDLLIKEVGRDFIQGHLRVPLDSPYPAQVVEPVLTHRTQVPYTPQARQAKVEGEVELQFVIREDGSTGRFMVLKYLEHGLDEQAIREISANWIFQPGTVDAEPYQFQTRLRIEFKPEGLPQRH